MLKHFATGLFVCVASAAFAGSPVTEPTAPAAFAAQDAPMTLPSSWKEFVAARMEMGDFGDWSTSGTTEAMWEGIPSGLKYANTETSELSSDGSYIVTSNMMRTEDGKVMSLGIEGNATNPYAFTNAGATGREGPTISSHQQQQCADARDYALEWPSMEIMKSISASVTLTS